jgi:hypothetical protein
MPGQLEQRPMRFGLVERPQLRRRVPLRIGQVAEGLLHPAKLHVEGVDGILVGAHQLLPALDSLVPAFLGRATRGVKEAAWSPSTVPSKIVGNLAALCRRQTP